MKRVIFKKQGMKNFCNHIDPVELEFGIGKLLMVTGPNGSGKTSMFQALPYTLYGVCEKGRGEDVLNDRTKKNCHVWTEFTIIDGDEVDNYRVDRYVKYTKLGNTAILTKNGTPIAKGHNEVVPLIEKIIVPYKLFTNTLLFGQKVKTFFTDLKDSEQKEIFRKILLLHMYVLYQKEANRQLKELNDELSEVINQIALKQGLIDSGKVELKRLIEEKKQFYILRDQEVIKLEQQVIPLQEKLNEAQFTVLEFDSKNLDSELEVVNTQIGVLTEKAGSIEGELVKAEKDINSQKLLKEAELNKAADDAKIKDEKEAKKVKDEILVANREVIDEKMNTIREIDLESTRISGRIDIINSNLTNLISRREDFTVDEDLTECPTCHQEINEDCIINLKNKIEEIDNESFELHTGREELEKQKQLKVKERSDTELSLSVLTGENKDKVDLINEELENTNTAIQERLTGALGKLQEMVNKSIESAKQSNVAERIAISGQIEEANKNKENITAEITKRDTAREQVTIIQNEIIRGNEAVQLKRNEEYNDSTIESIKDNEKQLISEKLRLNELKLSYEERSEILTFWSTGFSAAGIQSMLIDDSIPFMNEKISDYMDKLSNGRYTVTFDTLKATKAGEFRDKISVEVFDNVTHADSRVKISGGQERVVDIGTILTLSDLQSSVQNVDFNILLFDEIFDALDDENVGLVSNLIRQVAKDKWIGVISHRHIDQIEADEILSFR